MSIKRRWSANCDNPSCAEQRLLLGDQYDGKAELGKTLNDDGWSASPLAEETYCPNHASKGTQALGGDTA